MALQKTHALIAGTALAFAVILMTTTAAGLFQSSKTTNTGSIKGVKVSIYSDSSCTQPLTTIDWGLLDAGSSVNKTVYVKNEGNTAVVLNMTTDSWSSVNASKYITLSWNREGTLLAATNKVQALLVLSVSADIVGVTDFSFDAFINGIEQ